MSEDVKTVPEVAADLCVTTKTAYEPARRAELPSLGVGRVVRPLRKELERFARVGTQGHGIRHATSISDRPRQDVAR